MREAYFFEKVQRALAVLLILDLLAFLLAADWLRQPAGLESAAVLSGAAPAEAVPAAAEAGLFGNLYIECEEQISLSAARLLINGQDSGDFREGFLTARVRPGDVVQIDGSAYLRALSFSVEAVSASIDSSYLRAGVTSNGNIVDVGIIVFH